MTDDPVALRAEIARLRDLLEDHGIDPDPAPPEPEQYGPPTYMMWRMQQMLAATTRGLLLDRERHAADLAFFSGDRWPAGVLRIRLPDSFKVIPHA